MDTPKNSKLMLEDEEDTELEKPTNAAIYGDHLPESDDPEGNVIMLDSDLLDCQICQNPLQPPILQCFNGHSACSLCTDKIQDKKCPFCDMSPGFIRNRSLEAVVEGARISCSFRAFGCQAVVSYSQKVAHEADCHCAPCFCPFTGCDFQCSSPNLAAHIKDKHRCSATHKLNYTRAMNLNLSSKDSFLVLLDGRSPVFLVVISSDHMPSGRSIMLVCVRPSSPYSLYSYTYELEVSCRNGCKLQLKDKPVCTRWWSGDFAANNYLYVPNRMASTDKALQLMLRIRKLPIFD